MKTAEYNILEAKVVFERNQIQSIKVKVEISKGDVRAIRATTQPRGGYMHIQRSAKLNEDLLQQVAASGLEVNSF